MSSNGKSQPHIHAAGIALHWRIQKFLDLGEGDDFIEFPFDLLPGHPKDSPIQKYVLSAGQLRVKARPDFEQARHSSPYAHATFGRLRDPAEDLEQSGFPRTIGTNDADHLATADLKTHVPNCPNFFQVGAWNDGPTLQQVSRLVPNAPGVTREHITEGHVPSSFRLVTDHVFLAEIFGLNDDAAQARLDLLYKVRKRVFHLAKPADTQPQEECDDGEAENKARPVEGTSSTKNAPTEAIDHANQRIQTIKQPPLAGNHTATKTNW